MARIIRPIGTGTARLSPQPQPQPQPQPTTPPSEHSLSHDLEYTDLNLALQSDLEALIEGRLLIGSPLPIHIARREWE